MNNITINVTWAQLATAASVFLVVAGAFAYHLDKRIGHLSHEIDTRFEGMEKRFEERFKALDTRFDDLKDWIRAELKALEARLDRVEHPVSRP